MRTTNHIHNDECLIGSDGIHNNIDLPHHERAEAMIVKGHLAGNQLVPGIEKQHNWL